MDGTDKLQISIAGIVGVVIIAVVFLGTNYWDNYNAHIVKMVNYGADPIEAVCAMQDDHGQMPVCLVLATKK